MSCHVNSKTTQRRRREGGGKVGLVRCGGGGCAVYVPVEPGGERRKVGSEEGGGNTFSLFFGHESYGKIIGKRAAVQTNFPKNASSYTQYAEKRRSNYFFHCMWHAHEPIRTYPLVSNRISRRPNSLFHIILSSVRPSIHPGIEKAL